jgi:hypothetical protein
LVVVVVDVRLHLAQSEKTSSVERRGFFVDFSGLREWPEVRSRGSLQKKQSAGTANPA